MSSIPGDIGNSVNSVKTTFSSWDACMSKAYCKWPVIAGIVIGSLILLSLVWCIASCLCCGASLCGSCVQCLTCFGCCGACKGRNGGGGRSRHKDDYTQMPPTPYNGYHGQPSPMTYQPPSSGPQFAHFDTSSKNVHADSLPAMPTWESSRNRRVEDFSEQPNGYGNDVEMGRMTAPQQQQQQQLLPRMMNGGYNQVPAGPVSPTLPSASYGNFQGQAHPYSSDLGAQRLAHQTTGYSDFEPSPLSPAPTYRTNPPDVGFGNTAHFARGAVSPRPDNYYSQSHPTPRGDQAWSPLPSSHHEDTSYQTYRRSLSPPADHYSSSYGGQQQQDQSGVRPPSLLQIGRKPVLGSQREI